MEYINISDVINQNYSFDLSIDQPHLSPMAFQRCEQGHDPNGAAHPTTSGDSAHAPRRKGRLVPACAGSTGRSSGRMEAHGTHTWKDWGMDMNSVSLRRHRPAPRSKLPRVNIFLRFVADRHDLWLANRAHARWRRELHALDARILRDIGMTYAMIDDVSHAAHARDLARLRASAETTFPPHYDPSLAKLAPHIEV